jgi:DNA-binding IclR family transcriptional regulator
VGCTNSISRGCRETLWVQELGSACKSAPLTTLSEFWHPTPELLQLSNRYLDLNDLRSRALAWSELLAMRANEAVRVGALHGESVLIVHHVFRPDSTLQILEVGEMLPLHATALGKAVLAYLPAGVQTDLIGDELRKLTGHTLDTRTALKRELASVRKRGYALEREEAVIGEAGGRGTDLRPPFRARRRRRHRRTTLEAADARP